MGAIDDRSVFFCEDEARAVLAAVEEAEKRKRIGARSGLGDAGRGIHLVRIDAAQCHLQAEWLALAASRLRHRLGISDGGPTEAEPTIEALARVIRESDEAAMARSGADAAADDFYRVNAADVVLALAELGLIAGTADGDRLVDAALAVGETHG